MFGTLRQLVRSWIGFDGADSQVITTIFTGLFFTRVVWNHGGLFFSWFGYCMLGLCGMSVITGYLNRKKILCFNYWKRLSFILYHGFKPRESFLFLVLICGGRARFYVWTSANLYMYSGVDIVSCIKILSLI
jgi:hypothetical protein